MKDWTPTPPDRRRRARLLCGTVVDYQALRVGDVFQSLSVEGEPHDPFVAEADEQLYCLVKEPPRMALEGWELTVDIGPLRELKQALQ